MADLENLLTLIRHKEVVLFVGSGMSAYAGFPTANDLANTIYLNIPEDKRNPNVNLNLPEVAETYVRMFGREHLLKIITPIFSKDPENTKYHEMLSQIPQIKTIITTNYDRLFEIAYGDKIQVILNASDLVKINIEKITLFKLHGSIERPETILITKTDFENFFAEHRPEDLLWNEIKSQCARHAIMFIGYSLNDFNVNFLLRDIIHQLGSDHKGIYLITQKMEQYDIDYLNKEFGINYFELDAQAFVSKLKEQVELHKLGDFSEGYLTDKELILMLDRLHLSSQITRDSKGNKQISMFPDAKGEVIAGEITVQSKTPEYFKQIEEALTGSSFESHTISFDNAHDGLTLTLPGIGILPIGKVETEYKLEPRPVKKFKALLKVKNTDIIFTDLIGEAYQSLKSYLIKIENSVISFRFEPSKVVKGLVDVKFHFEGTHNPLKDFVLYNMLNAWGSGNPLVLLVEGEPHYTEITSKVIQNESAVFENIKWHYSFLKDILEIQDYLGCAFQNISYISEQDLQLIEIFMRATKKEKIKIESCSAIISPKDRRLFSKILKEGSEVIRFTEKKEVILFGMVILLDSEALIHDAYIEDSKKILKALKFGKKNLPITIRSRSGNAFVIYTGRFIYPQASATLSAS